MSLVLQQGVIVPLSAASDANEATVRSFVQRLLNIGEQAFHDEVKTLMVNSRVVDDPNGTMLADGDVVVVSGALPGLVGAMLRSDSPIKALRQTITSVTNRNSASPGGGFVVLKAFNTVLRDHLDDIIEFGVYVREGS